MNDVIQTVIVLLIVVWSLSVTLRRFMPSRLQQRVANRLQRKGWLKLGEMIAPAQNGCGSGCHSCQSSCTPDLAKTEHVVQWRK